MLNVYEPDELGSVVSTVPQELVITILYVDTAPRLTPVPINETASGGAPVSGLAVRTEHAGPPVTALLYDAAQAPPTADPLHDQL